MKLSPIQILVVSIFLASGALLALFALTGGGGAPADPDAFLNEVRQRADAASETEDNVAPMPGAATPTSLLPQIRIDPPAPSFGPIPNEGMFETAITVHNDGAGPLIIGKISTECPCTQGQMDTMTIPPGGSAPMRIYINPDIIHGFETTKALTVSNNDPRRRQLDIPVTTKVIPEFSVTPEKVDFGSVTKGETPSIRVRLAQVSDEPFEVTGVGFSDELSREFEAAFERVPEAEWAAPGRPEFDVVVTLRADAAVGAYAREVVVANTTRRLPQFRLSAQAEVRTFYRIEPVITTFGGSVKVGTTEPVDLRIIGTSPIAVDGITTDIAGITFRAVPGDEPNTVTFEMTAAADASPGTKTGIATISVRSGDSVTTERRAITILIAETEVN